MALLAPIPVDVNFSKREEYDVAAQNEEPLSVVLTRRWSSKSESFLKLQVLKQKDGNEAICLLRHGQVGEESKTREDKFKSSADALAHFADLFEQATGNKWKGNLSETMHSVEHVSGKFVLLSRTHANTALPGEEVALPQPPSRTPLPAQVVMGNASVKKATVTEVTVAAVQSEEEVEARARAISHASSVATMRGAVGFDVDEFVPNAEAYEVFLENDEPWSAVLSKVETEGEGRSSFMILQLLRRAEEGEEVFCFSRWGWLGSDGQTLPLVADNAEEAKNEFAQKFFDASGNEWRGSATATLEEFESVEGKYTLVDLEECVDFAEQCRGSEANSAVAASVQEEVSHGKSSSKDGEATAAKQEATTSKSSKSSSAKKKTMKVDRHVEDADSYKPVMTVKLKQRKEKGKFYVIQLLQKGEGYHIFLRSGRVGSSGSPSLKEATNLASGKKAFEKKFEEKTKNKWLGTYEKTAKAFTPVEGDDEIYVLESV